MWPPPIRKETKVTGHLRRRGDRQERYLCEDDDDPQEIRCTKCPALPAHAAFRPLAAQHVPLILHDEILGTFNVESPRPGAFNENDLQFLELFSREVAVALNTFSLRRSCCWPSKR